jgi:hypothetical protein
MESGYLKQNQHQRIAGSVSFKNLLRTHPPLGFMKELTFSYHRSRCKTGNLNNINNLRKHWFKIFRAILNKLNFLGFRVYPWAYPV